MMEVESFFLKYAFPCSFILQQRGEISEEQFEELESAAAGNRPLPRELLEKIYHRAFERISKLALEMGRGKWDISVIKEYFIVRHNTLIEQGMYSYAEAPEKLKELCKVLEARVVRLDRNVAVVEYSGKKRPVMTELVPELKEGDYVRIHYGYAVEKL